jgi:hypothetical protein
VPSAEKSPVREREAPMLIGAEDDDPLADELADPVEVVPVEVVPVELLLLLHAARTPTESATAPSVTAFLENQGRCALTPGSSFLIAHDCSESSTRKPPGAYVREVYRRVPCAAR